jgi:hypothetical protein
MVYHDLPRPAVVLGLAGIVPQAVCVVIVAMGGEWRWVALAAGCFYAAVILSFLGGLWWMAALQQQSRRWTPYLLGVIASLAAWVALLPWCLGWTWPQPSLVLLALCLAASPLADRWLASRFPLARQWLRLRLIMASMLAMLTLSLAVA